MDFQQPNFYRFSEDSILLAKHAAHSAKLSGSGPKSLMDIGSGCGVVGIETAKLVRSIQSLALIEPQKEFSPYIECNMSLLREGVDAKLFSMSISEFCQREGGVSGLKFDLIVSNPPYFKEGEGRRSPNKNKAFCRSFTGFDLAGFVKLAQGLLSSNGQGFILGHHSNPDLKEVAKLPGVAVDKVFERGASSVSVLKLLNKNRS